MYFRSIVDNIWEEEEDEDEEVAFSQLLFPTQSPIFTNDEYNWLWN